MRDRFGHEPLHEYVDARIQRGREQQPLGRRRRRLEDAPDRGQEAEVGHVVGLVEHGDLDRVELRVPGLDVVLEPARAGDDDVGTLAQAGDLRAVTDTAEDRHRAQVERVGERRDRRLDLRRQLAGRGQDQRARVVRPALGPAGREPSQHRQDERVGLSRAGPAAAENILAGQGIRQRRRLDRERLRHAGRRQRGHYGRGDAEIGEREVVRDNDRRDLVVRDRLVAVSNLWLTRPRICCVGHRNGRGGAVAPNRCAGRRSSSADRTAGRWIGSGGCRRGAAGRHAMLQRKSWVVLPGAAVLGAAARGGRLLAQRVCALRPEAELGGPSQTVYGTGVQTPAVVSRDARHMG